MRVIYRSITFSVVVPDLAGKQGNQIRFPDVPELREVGTLVYGLQTFSQSQVSRTLQPNLPVITAADTLTVLFTLLEKSNQRFKQLPWAIFSQATNFGNWFEMVPFEMNVQGSFINFTGDTTAVSAFTIPVTAHYTYPQDRK